jgi:hypothetical protein
MRDYKEEVMGYRSDIRFLVPLEDYKRLKTTFLKKYGEDSYFNFLDKSEIRKDSDGSEFMYFGWNSARCCDEVYEIESAVSDLDQYHRVRIGEDWTDIDEGWNLGDSDVDCIGIIRNFEEDEKELVFTVMLRDAYDSQVINECTVFYTKAQAQRQLKTVAEDYKAEFINEQIKSGLVGFGKDTDKNYVLIETDESFSYYRQGNYNDCHIEVWIIEREILQNLCEERSK